MPRVAVSSCDELWALVDVSVEYSTRSRGAALPAVHATGQRKRRDRERQVLQRATSAMPRYFANRDAIRPATPFERSPNERATRTPRRRQQHARGTR